MPASAPSPASRPAALLLALGTAASLPATAATYVVNSTDADLPDVNTALASCDANAGQIGDQCTLRAALMQANAGASADTIVVPLNTTITLTLAGAGAAELGDLDILHPVTVTSIVLGAPANADAYPRIVAAHGDRLFDVDSPAVTLRGLRMEGGEASTGGAVRVAAGGELTVDRSRFQDNEAVHGGAIANSGTLLVSESDFDRNRVSGDGSAIRNLGSATLRGSSFRRVRDTSAVAEAVFSGQDSTLVVENSFFDGTATGLGATDTGGIHGDAPEFLLVRNSTLTDFTGTALHVFGDPQTQVSVHNSILAGSGFTDCSIVWIDAAEPTVTIGNSLLQDPNCLAADHPGNLVGVDPGLGAAQAPPASLAYHRPPLLNAPVIDAGFVDNGLLVPVEAPCLGDDQLGNMRPQDGDGDGEARCDMGSVEFAAVDSSTFHVNLYTQDAQDANPGDDSCDTDPGQAGSQCTLRAAVMEANAKAGPDLILFERNEVNADTLELTLGGLGSAAFGDLDVTEQVAFQGQAVAGRPVTRIVGAMAGERLFDVSVPPAHVVRFSDLILSGGDSDENGGAVRLQSDTELTLERLEIAGNEAAQGGGAVAALAGRVRILASDLHDNHAGDHAGAVLASGASLDLQRSSVHANGTGNAASSEAIRVAAAADQPSRVLTSTVSGNEGGVRVIGVPAMEVRASTIVDNGGIGVLGQVSGTLQVVASLIADNAAADCLALDAVVLDADHHNLIGDGGCAGASNLSGNPRLAPALTRRDGQLTRVRIPLPDSPANDAIPQGNADCPDDADQHFRVRPSDTINATPTACEIGAWEVYPAEYGPRHFTVNRVDGDFVDATPGDTRCDTSGATGDQCTLRAAVMESNALPGFNSVSIGSGLVVPLTRPSQGGPPDASHGDLDLLDDMVLTGILNVADLRPTVTGGHGDRLFNISAPGATVELRGLRLTGGATGGSGGAVRVVNASDVLLERLDIFANTADQGGGGLAVLAGDVQLLDSDVHGNATGGLGGGVRNDAVLWVRRSSLRDNLDSSADREALWAGAASATFIENSTVSGNDGDGARVIDGTLDLQNATVFDNSGWGVYLDRADGEALAIASSILAGHGSGACTLLGAGAIDLSSDNHNLVQGGGCALEAGATNLVTEDPLLTPLLTEATLFSAYHLPLAGSAAIDAGHLAIGGVGCPDHDQHGASRPVDGNGDGFARCDIGAIEAPSPGDALFSDGFED